MALSDTRISFGFGALGPVQRRRLIRRGSIVLGILASVFSFVSVDLARKDALFATGVDVVDTNVPPVLEIALSNISGQTMKNLNVSYGFYDSAGALVRVKTETGNWGGPDDNRFVPANMAIGPKAAKYGPIAFADIERPPAEIASILVCAIFDGSFWFDQVRTEYVLTRIATGFGQRIHDTRVYYLRTPDCLPPERLPPLQ